MYTVMNNFLTNNTLSQNHENLSPNSHNEAVGDEFNCLLNDKQLTDDDDIMQDNQSNLQQNIGLASCFNFFLQESVDAGVGNINNLQQALIIDNNQINNDKMNANILSSNLEKINELTMQNDNLDATNKLMNQEDFKILQGQINQDFVENVKDMKFNLSENTVKNAVENTANINDSKTQKISDTNNDNQNISDRKLEVDTQQIKELTKSHNDNASRINEVDNKLTSEITDSITVIDQNTKFQSETVATVQQTPKLELNQNIETLQKISDYIQKSIVSNSKEIEIQLNPEHLGKILIKASVESGDTKVQITCFTEQTKDIITRCAGDIGGILQNRIGGETTIYVDAKYDENAWNPNNQQDNNKQQHQNRDKEEKTKQNDKVECNLDFVQQLRLGIS